MRNLIRLACVLGPCWLWGCASAPPSVYVDESAPVFHVPPNAASDQFALNRPAGLASPLPTAAPKSAPPRAPIKAPQLPPQPYQQQARPSAASAPVQEPIQAAPLQVYGADPLDASVYQLGSGDTVRIDVLGEVDLSLEALIDPSGLINYPFLGTVQAAGGTVRDLELKIRNGLRGGYLVNPDVRVGLARYRPVFISGQVRQPGSYPFSLGLNVEKAITLAGGVTPFGSTSRIYRQRNGISDSDRIKVSLDSAVLPGDYIIIEERMF